MPNYRFAAMIVNTTVLVMMKMPMIIGRMMVVISRLVVDLSRICPHRRLDEIVQRFPRNAHDTVKGEQETCSEMVDSDVHVGRTAVENVCSPPILN